MSTPLDEGLCETLEAGLSPTDPTRTTQPNGSDRVRASASLPTLIPQHRDRLRYEIVGEHGRGGLGRVSRAHDRELGRDIAIKELIARTHTAEVRFMREALITARLEHPGIVPVYEAGRWSDGTPFYAMKLVSGRPLRDLIGERQTVAERIGLLHHVIAVADAIAYAHGRNIIHRDLKPANVIVGDFGETVVIDWGLAKDITADELDAVGGGPFRANTNTNDGLTSTGAVLGTPSYMAPEQERGEVVDQRADVYAIGAMLWELCALQKLGSGSNADRRRTLRDTGIDPDLAAIVLKACDPVPAHRYRDAGALATDLKAFKAGARIAGRSYSPWGVLVHWVRRHRWITASVVAAAVVAVVGSALYVHDVASERDRADAAVTRLQATNTNLDYERAAAIEQRNALILAQATAALDLDPTRSLEWLARYPADGADWDRVQVIAADARSRGTARHILPTMAATSSISADGTLVVTAGPYETVRVWSLASGEALGTLRARGRVVAARISPDSKTIAVGDHLGGVVLWSPHTGEQADLGALENGVLFVEYAPDGKLLVSSSLNAVVVWDVADRKRVWSTATRDPVTALAMAPDGHTVVFGTNDGVLHVQDLVVGRARSLAGHAGAIDAIAFSADGRLASGGRDGTIRLWDLAIGSGRILGRHDGLVRDLRFSPVDPTVLASSGADGKVRVWSSAGATARVLAGHTDMVNGLAFSRDGTTLASVSPDRQVRLWDLATGDSRVLVGHHGDLGDVAFSPDGMRLVTSGWDQETRVWELAPPAGRLFGRHEFEALQAVFSPDGTRIASMGSDRTARLWDVASGAELPLHGAEYTALSVSPGLMFSASGSQLASVGDNAAHVWDLATGEVRDLVARTTLLRKVALSADGRAIAVAGADGTVRLWTTGAEAAVLAGHTAEVMTVAFVPHGDRLISAGTDGALWSWDLASHHGEVLGHHGAAISQIAVSPDGTLVASASDDGAIRLWNLAQHTSRQLAGHTGGICELRFSADGRLLASASMDTTARIWNVATGEARVLRGHDEGVRAIAVSPDGTLVATGANDRTVRLWNLATGDLAILRGHHGAVRSVAFDPSGRRVVSASEDATLRLWDLDRVAPVPHDRGALAAWLHVVTTTDSKHP